MRRARLLLSLALLAACTPAPTRDPAVVQDVLDYVARIEQWEHVEALALRAIRDVRQNQFVDDDYVIATLGAVMDDVELHLEQVDVYQPRTPAVRAIHEHYAKAWHDLHDAFASIIGSMERKDYLALSKGTEEMQRARGELVVVAAQLSGLMEETGLRNASGRTTG